MIRVVGRPRRYDWGSPDLIPALLGAAPDGVPLAELWFGDHRAAVSAVVAPALEHVGGRGSAENSTALSLDRVIEADPLRWLGEDCVRSFGDQLPFLVKLLAAAEPLSIQVHPNSAQARSGFAHEVAAGVPAAERSYLDPRHKPEALIALTRVAALAGMRPPQAVADDLAEIGHPALVPAVAALRAAGAAEDRLAEGLACVLRLEAPALGGARRALTARHSHLHPLVQRLVGRHVERHADPGAFAAIFLEDVALERGQALFIPAGMLHCYIEGFGLEVMASSDNVLRAGLTSKRVDVKEVLRITDFTPTRPQVIDPIELVGGAGLSELNYPLGADEFSLLLVHADTSDPVTTSALGGPRLVTCLANVIVVHSGTGHLALAAGEAALVAPGESLQISGRGTAAVVYVPRVRP